MILREFKRNALGFMVVAGLCVGANGCSKSDDEEDGDNFTLKGSGAGASLAQDPGVAKIKLYSFAVSESEYCTDPVVVIDNGDEPVDFDMMAEPDMGTGTIPDGTYPCVIMKMGAALTAAATEDDGVCEADKEFSQNVCGGGGGGGDGYTIDFDGEAQDCPKKTDIGYLYLSTKSTADQEDSDACPRDDTADEHTCNSWEPPTKSALNRGVPLGSALVVKGSAIGIFKITDLQIAVEGGGNDGESCGLQRPTFTFTTGS